MPFKSRTFSELLAEDAESGFLQQRDQVFSAKRRKTDLNSRFDRMIEATYRSPKRSIKSRARSSSASSYNVPQTPIDMYEGLQAGALGEHFAIIKKNSNDDQNTRCTAPLPDWLSNTFSTLTENHPLRLLLPSSMQDTNAQDTAQAREMPLKDYSEDVFAFKPSPASHDPSHNLRSPITFRTQTETSLSTDYPLSSSHFQPFSTPGPASSIRQPSPPRSFVSKSRVASPVQDDHYQSSYRTEHVLPNSSPVDLVDSHIPARASSLLAPLPSRHAYNANSLTANNDPETHVSTAASLDPPVYFRNDPNDFNSPNSPVTHAHANDIEGDFGIASERQSEMLNVFSAPGPVYISSRPVYLDVSAHDPSSDAPALAYEVDYNTLDFQWKSFDRKSTQFPETGLHNGPISIQPKPLIPEPNIEDLDTLPPSSDQPSGNDSNESYNAPRTSKSSSTDHELPLPTSSDKPYDEPVDVNCGEKDTPSTVVQSEHLPSPSPFRFRPPSHTHSLNQTVVPSEKSSARRRTLASRPNDRRSTSSKLSNLKATPSAKSDDRRVLPSSSGYAVRPEVEDIDALKNDLLNALDKIAPSPARDESLKRNEKGDNDQIQHPAARSRSVPQPFPVNVWDSMDVDEMVDSQDSIESWTEERELARLDH